MHRTWSRRSIEWTWCASFAAAALQAQTPPSPPTPAPTPALRVEGIVVDALGEPIPLAEVYVPSKDGGPEPRTRCDGAGLFVLGRVPEPVNGYVTIRATAPGKTEAAESVRMRDGGGSARVQLFDATTLTGEVVDAEGKAVAGAQVSATFDIARISFLEVLATSDAEGKFTLDKVPLGAIDVRAVAPGRACVGVLVHVRGKPDGERPVRIELPQKAGLPLAVEVTGLRPGDAGKVQVRLLPYIDGSLQELPPSLVKGTLDAQGKWQASGLPEAEYLVQLSAQGLSFAPRELRLYAQFRGTRTIGPRADPTTEPVARFVAHYATDTVLRGHLRDPDGKPLAGETLVLRASNGGYERTAKTDDDGAFRIESPLAPGSECVFFLRGSSWLLAQQDDSSAPHLDRRDLLWHETKVDPGTPVELVAKRPAVVVGRLVDAEGQPVRWANIALQESQPNRLPLWMQWTSSRTAKDGSFRFQVAAMADPARVAVEGPAGVATSEPFALAWGQLHNVGDIRVKPAATIAGVVRDGQGQPVAGARVWLRDWDMATGQQRSGSVVETITDRAGRYRFLGVPPGGAWLQVALHGDVSFERAVEPFEVANGERLSFDLVTRR